MARIRVAVSPFYGGEAWIDEATGIQFEKNIHGLTVYSIPENVDLSGVQKAIRLNALMLIEGNLPQEAEEVIVPEPVVELPVEEVEEVQAEAEEVTTKLKVKKASKK